MALIDIAVPGFLLSEPPPAGTQDAQLSAPLAVRLYYSQEPPIPSNDEAKEPPPEPIQKEDPEDAPSTSYRCLHPAQVSTNQEATNIPEGMGFEEKTPPLLALLTAHTEGSSLAVAVVP